MERSEPIAIVITAEPRSVAEWANYCAAPWQDAVLSIIDTGRRIGEALAKLPHGAKGEFYAALPFSERTAQKLAAIAEHPTLSNPAHGPDLPASWRTLNELSKVEPERLEDLIERGVVHAGITRAEATEVVAAVPLSEEEQASLAEAEQIIGANLAAANEVLDALNTRLEDATELADVIAVHEESDQLLTALRIRTLQAQRMAGQLLNELQEQPPDDPATWSEDVWLAIYRRHDVTPHPALDLIPHGIYGEEWSSFVRSVEQFGVLQPVVVNQHGVLLDGRNRLAAADIVGVSYRVDVRPTYDTQDELDIIWAANFIRQQLTPGERAMAEMELEELS